MWKVSESTISPPHLDTTSSKTHVYVRRNVVEVEATEDRPKMYRYEENVVPKEDWETYKQIMELQVTTDDITLVLAELIGG